MGDEFTGFGEKLEKALLTPIRAFRLRYLPLLMVYFAYGALGIITIAESFWIKSALTLTPSELAALSVWLTLPWTIKMVFGELIDAVPIFGSQRRSYVVIGGVLVALGLLDARWSSRRLDHLCAARGPLSHWFFSQRSGSRSPGRCGRRHERRGGRSQNSDGSPRDPKDVNRDLAMVRSWERLALSLGLVVVAGLVAGSRAYSLTRLYFFAAS